MGAGDSATTDPHAPVPPARHPGGRHDDLRAGLSGLLAAGTTLAVGHLVAALVSPSAGPLTAVGDTFVDATPPWLKDLAIATFGVQDKLALFVGMALVLATLATGIGLLARRRPTLGTLAIALLGLVGVLTAVTRPDAVPLAFLPSAVGALAGALALRTLLARVTPARTAPPDYVAPGLGPDRRSFLGAAVLITVAAALTAGAGTAVGSLGRAVTSARERIRLPAPTRPATPLPDGVQSATPGVVDFVTPNDAFYRIDTALTLPQVDPATWSLRVHGMVDQEVTLTYDDLLAADLVEAWVTLTCVSNPVGGDLIDNAKWLGLPIRDLLAQAGPLPGADMVLSTSADGFTASTPLPVLTDDRDAILAVAMNDEPLPVAHGFPVRMVVPGLYGYVSATKWVVDLEVTTFAEREAYWTQRGWAPRGPIKTSARLEVPRQGTTVPAGPVAVGGTAWAQHTGIAAVQVQVDDGPWQEATLSAEVSVDTWRQWSWTWDATPGDHVLRTRATDADGQVQTAEEASPVPDGASGWHAVEVTVEPA